MFKKSGLISLLAVLMAAPVASAPEETAWLDVEVLVFEHLTTAASEREPWPALRPTPEYNASPPAPANLTDAPGAQYLPPGALHLQRERTALSALPPDYRPLLHVAWRQPVGSEELPWPVRLRTPGEKKTTSSSLDGVVTVSGRHSPRFDADLRLSEALTPAGAQTAQIHHYRLHASRSMNNAELHYLDHPRFGMLAWVQEQSAVKGHKGPTG